MKNFKNRYISNQLSLGSTLFRQWPGGDVTVKDYLGKSRRGRKTYIFVVSAMLVLFIVMLLLCFFGLHQYITKTDRHTTDYLVGIIIVGIIPVFAIPFYFSSLKWMVRNYRSSKNNFN